VDNVISTGNTIRAACAVLDWRLLNACVASLNRRERCLICPGRERLTGELYGTLNVGIFAWALLPHLSKERSQGQAARVDFGPVVLEPVSAAGHAQ